MGSTNDNHYTTSAVAIFGTDLTDPMSKCRAKAKTHIPEGTRTPNLRLRKPTPCPFGHWDAAQEYTSSGTRTHNLTLRRGAPYPLGHGGTKKQSRGLETANARNCGSSREAGKKKKFMPGVGFEPTRTKRPADLKSAPLDPSGIQAK